MDADILLTDSQVAVILGISRQTMNYRIGKGDGPKRRKGGFAPADLRLYIDRQTNEAIAEREQKIERLDTICKKY